MRWITIIVEDVARYADWGPQPRDLMRMQGFPVLSESPPCRGYSRPLTEITLSPDEYREVR